MRNNSQEQTVNVFMTFSPFSVISLWRTQEYHFMRIKSFKTTFKCKLDSHFLKKNTKCCNLLLFICFKKIKCSSFKKKRKSSAHLLTLVSQLHCCDLPNKSKQINLYHSVTKDCKCHSELLNLI